MSLLTLTDREAIAAFYRPNAAAHLYEIGDLDDFFWPDTTWYGLEDNDTIRQIALLYTAGNLPILLAMTEPERLSNLKELLAELLPVLPDRIYMHITASCLPILTASFQSASYGMHWKMALTNPAALDAAPRGETVDLAPGNRIEVEAFYQAAYPYGWFDSRMLETEQYVGVRDDTGKLVCVAGVHVYAPTYRCAALGNIATLPSVRGKGHATTAVAALCRKLLQTTDAIGLNVRQDNEAAIRCYTRLGFTTVSEYEEVMLTR